ncbi:LLM class flavin-dependent oxidoreductase [Streptomyces sp. NPDC059786]|uniref:LLM class flavin-dependent oxidoreductase n=1 Tax=Streptomyces sp. NPDC059786 TaxID=3346946 RepID=UPI00366362EF
MTARNGRGLLHLAAALDERTAYGAASPVDPVARARLAERGALDFVTLGDTFARPGFDALAVLSRAAPATGRIGLVPTVTTTHTAPFHVQAAVATLDWVSRGRAGWQLDVSATEGEARLFGRRHAASAEDLWREAGEVADAAARLWDSGEEIRGTGRSGGAGGGRGGDAGRVVVDGSRAEDSGRPDEGVGHAVGGREVAWGAGFAPGAVSVRGPSPVRGPSAVPRPPQGHPVRVVDATGRHARRTAARCADVALVQVADPGQARAVRAELRDAAAGSGRDPDGLRVLVSLTVDLGDGEYAAERGHGGGGPRRTAQGPLYRGGPVDLAELVAAWHEADAADGFHFVPAEPHRDLERLVNGTVALLQHRGLFRTFYPGSTLREHLGLARPARRYALAGEAS